MDAKPTGFDPGRVGMLRYGGADDLPPNFPDIGVFEPEGQMHGLRIAPLILYSFVESCFVHGAGENPMQSWIRIELKVQDSRLFFRISNSVPGIGYNENSIRRLELAYPNRHRLAIRENKNEHQVELHLSL